MSIDQAAAELLMSRRTLERRIAAGEIAVFRDGRIRGIRLVDVERYVARKTCTPTASLNTTPAVTPRRGVRVPAGQRLWDVP
jgi:excisionase family DNA binding protein